MYLETSIVLTAHTTDSLDVNSRCSCSCSWASRVLQFSKLFDCNLADLRWQSPKGWPLGAFPIMSMSSFWLSCLLTVFLASSSADSLVNILALAKLPHIEVDFVGWIDNATQSIITDTYQQPTGKGLDTFALATKSLLLAESNESVSDAIRSFSELNYIVARITDLSQDPVQSAFIGLVPRPWILKNETNRSDGRGSYFYRPNAINAIAFGVPHPVHDKNTATLSSLLFRELNARSFFMSTVHRCTSKVSSGCRGLTKVCSKDGLTKQPYTVSDMAHSPSSFFQTFHEILSTVLEDTYSVSVHGKGFRDGQMYNVGDGTMLTTMHSKTLIFKAHLDNNIHAVNETAAAGYSCNYLNSPAKLCGTTNVQGLWSNKAADTCTSRANQSTDTFMHLELSGELLNSGRGTYSFPESFDGMALVVAAFREFLQTSTLLNSFIMQI